MSRLEHPFVHSVLRLVLTALIAQVLISHRLWDGAGRSFPALPLIEEVGFTGSLLCIIITILLAVSVFIFIDKQWLLVMFGLWLVGLSLLDLNRLQPWLYFYLLLFLLYLLSAKNQENHLRYAWQWLLAAVYCWSGFHKFTPYFAEDNFPWFCAAFALTKPLAKYPILGYGIAAVEFALGALLLWPRSRAVARWLVVGFHVYNIAVLPAIGWNWVVIPWNIAMAGMVWLVFQKRPLYPDASGILQHDNRDGSRRQRVLQIALTFIWLSPAVNFIGLFPEALSWKMYSNTQPEATFYSTGGKPPCATLPDSVRQKFAFDGGTKLLAADWAMADLQVPVFATEHTLKQWGRTLCNCTEATVDSSGIYLLTVHPFNKSKEKLVQIPCRELLRR